MADAEEIGKIPKPQMKGLLMAQIKRNLILAFTGCVVAGCLFQFGYINRRKQIYANFYKNYDIDKEFNRIRRKGLFDSCDAVADGDDDDEDS